MKRKGFLSRLADKLFGGVKKPRRKATRRQSQKRAPEPAPSSVFLEPEIQEPRDYVNYTLAGWRVEGGEWHDSEANPHDLPENNGGKNRGWINIDLVTVNLAPDTEDGFYRSANVLGGFDEHKDKPRYDYYDEDPAYTLDNLAYELALEYGFAVQ